MKIKVGDILFCECGTKLKKIDKKLYCSIKECKQSGKFFEVPSSITLKEIKKGGKY